MIPNSPFNDWLGDVELTERGSYIKSSSIQIKAYFNQDTIATHLQLFRVDSLINPNRHILYFSLPYTSQVKKAIFRDKDGYLEYKIDELKLDFKWKEIHFNKVEDNIHQIQYYKGRYMKYKDRLKLSASLE